MFTDVLPGNRQNIFQKLHAVCKDILQKYYNPHALTMEQINMWLEAFENACRRSGRTAEIHRLSIDRRLRSRELAAICSTKPPAIFSNGWETMLALLELLDAEFPGYRPRLICHANCRAPFLGDSRISGIITSSTTKLIEKSCRMLIKQIDNPGQKKRSPTALRSLGFSIIPRIRRIRRAAFSTDIIFFRNDLTLYQKTQIKKEHGTDEAPRNHLEHPASDAT